MHSNRLAAEKQMLNGVLTKDYRPTPITRPRWYDMGLPPFSIYMVELMRLDARVRLAMGIKMSPLLRVSFTVSGREDIRAFALEQLQNFWRKAAHKCWSALWYSTFAAECVYRVRNNRVVLAGMMSI